MSLEENVKEKVLSLGADFVGIAPSSRFEAAPEHARAEKLMPKFKSVVAYGIAMDRGSLEAYFSKASRRPIRRRDSRPSMLSNLSPPSVRNQPYRS